MARRYKPIPELKGPQALAVAVVEPSWTNFHVAYRVGSRHSLTAGAAGKAMSLRPGGDGWVTSAGELEAGASGVAAPVRGVPGLRASVGVVSMEPLKAAEVGPQVVAAATRLADILKA